MKRWTFVLIVSLLLFSLACAVFQRGNQPTAEPGTASPGTATEVKTPEPTTEDTTIPEISADALQQLDSYRARMTMRTEFEDETQEVSILQEYIREPFASRMVMESTDAENGAGKMEIIQVGKTQWLNFGGSWMQTEASGEDDFQDMLLDYRDIVQGNADNDYQYIGRETVNGIRTKHYRLKLNDLQLQMLGTEMHEATSDVWIADESNLPAFTVKVVIVFKGELEQGRVGTGTLTQEVFDVNQNFTIEPPEEALSGGLPEDVPLYPGATGVSTMMGFVTFETTDDMETVQAFYDKALKDNGWTSDGSEFMPTWTKGNRSLNLFISEKDEGGSSVTIMISAEE